MVEPKISKNFKLKESTNLLLEYASKRFQKTQTSIVEWGIQLIFEQTFNKKEVSPIDIQNLEENLEQETDITREILIQVKEEITKKRKHVQTWAFVNFENGIPIYRCTKHNVAFYIHKHNSDCPACMEERRLNRDLESYK